MTDDPFKRYGASSGFIGREKKKKKILRPRVGFRVWRLKCPQQPGELMLYSGWINHLWRPGRVQVASCLDPSGHVVKRPQGHRAPERTCNCGLHGFFSIKGAISYSPETPRLVGAVRAWGKVQVHRTGFRAEKVEVLALCMQGHAGYRQSKELSEETLREVAGRYGVPLLLDYEGLEAYASEFKGF